MDLNFLFDYVNVVTMGICLCLGYVIKTSMGFIPNKYIPLIMLLTGTLLTLWCSWGAITSEVILGGMISGLASTGAYEAIRSLSGRELEN